MAKKDRLSEAWDVACAPLLDITRRVSKYPELTEAEINEKASGSFGRDYDLYPDPFPRDGSILLPGEATEVRNVVEKIGRLFRGRASTAYASVVLQYAVQACVSKQGERDRLVELAMALKYLAEFDQEWTFIFPVENLVLHVGKLKIGPVRFQRTTEGDAFLRWRRRETRLAAGNAPFLAGMKAMPPWVDPTSGCDAWASVRTKGDSILAEERAFELVTRAIDIIRLFVARSETVGIRGSVNFGLGGQAAGGETSVGYRRSRVDSTPTRTRTFQTLKKEQRYGPAATYKGVITADTLSVMRQGGLDPLALAVGKANRSQLEDRVFRALAWYSEAVTSGHEIDRFLKLVFAIDALVGGGPEGEGATTDIAERAAFILRQEVQHRRSIKTEIVRFFRLTGDFAHGSRKAVPFGDLFGAELDCQQLIRRFAVDHMPRGTFDAFLEWVEEQKLSTP